MKQKSLLLTAMVTLAMAAAILLPMQTMAQNVPSYVPNNGLVGWWPFNGNANDASGNGNNGTVNNGAVLTTDRFGGLNSAYNLDGDNDFISVNPSTSLNIVNNISISIWFYTTQTGFYGYLVDRDICGNAKDWSLAYNGSSILRIGDGATDQIINSASNNINSWHNLVFVRNGNSFKLFIDGVISGQILINGLNFLNNLTPIFFGEQLCNPNSVNSPNFNGKIDDIGIWNRALTQQEVTALYNSTTNTCPLITSVTLNAQQTQSSVTNAVVGYLPNSTKIISDTTQWHYIALTKSGPTGNFYFDGTLVTSSSFASNPYIWNSLLLGAIQGCVSCSPVADFNGLIDEVRVSNVARTASNIASAYSANSPFTADVSTIGLFHLDNTTGNSINNAIGGTAATFGTPALASGKFGQAMSFDGVDDYVRWSSSIPVNNMTIEFWVKSSDQSATMAMLEYAYNTGIYLQSSTVTNPILWSTGDTTNTITVNPTQLPYVWVSNGSCSDTIFFNSQSATQYDTVTTTVTVYDTVTTTINDTVTTYLSVTDTLIINVTLTGINPPNNSNTLLAYPNPASDHLIIDCGDFAGMAGYTMKISNSLGQIVFNQPITQQLYNIDLSSWGGKGTYILVIQDPAQTVKASKKIVLQ